MVYSQPLPEESCVAGHVHKFGSMYSSNDYTMKQRWKEQSASGFCCAQEFKQHYA